MGRSWAVAALLCLWAVAARAEDPYIYLTWNITAGTVSPLGVPHEGILINGQFPGPRINGTTNNNVVINVFNNLDEPFLLSWHGIQQRKNSWVDGTMGTMCPIPPGANYTYHLQLKDQIGSFFYYPSTSLHKASGAFGELRIYSRNLIPVPFDPPAGDFSILAGDWYNKGHKDLKKMLDSGRTLGKPDGIHINGKSGQVDGKNEPLYTMEKGKVYRYRFCNVGIKSSLNVRFQNHKMKLVEMEGSHVVQNVYDSLDMHVGQCFSVLVTADQEPKDYYLVVSSRFLKPEMSAVALIRYADGKPEASKDLPQPPPEGPEGIDWSINQFRSFRWNLTASAARPNPQGSYHYGQINITRTIRLSSSCSNVDGKLRYAINSVSHVDPPTPLKLAEYYKAADKVFKYGLMQDQPGSEGGENSKVVVEPNVINGTFHRFIEVIFENTEKSVQTYHVNGYAFFAVAVESGRWSQEKRQNYNLLDAVSRNTIQVYPGSWAAVLLALDNAGMWNLRSEIWERAYLGQQLYLSVLSPEGTVRDEYNVPDNALLCGIVKEMPKPKPYGIHNTTRKPKEARKG